MKKWFIDQFDGNGSSFPLTISRHVRWLIAALAAGGLLSGSSTFSQTPTASLIYTATGPIQGGVAAGPDGALYFAALSSGTVNSKVTALNPNHTLKWALTSPVAGTAGDFHPVPSVDLAGAKVFVGPDAGVLYCLNTSDGSVAWQYPASGTLTAPIRSSAALDPNSPLGSTVYFQGNDGYLYALNAGTGALRWSFQTGNQGGAGGNTFDPWPLSSSPVIGSDGTVYVATAVNTPSPDGKVYAINPSTGQSAWPSPYAVPIGQPIEASIAIGLNGWLYVGTRQVGNCLQQVWKVSAIDPAAALLNPSTAVKWNFSFAPECFGDADPGVLASPVIDQSGYVYVCDPFGELIVKLDPFKSNPFILSWSSLRGLSQTPSINQDGLIILGTSTDPFDDSPAPTPSIDAFSVASPAGSGPVWSIANANFGNFFGASAIRCADGAIYLADDLGKVWKVSTTRSMMAGIWPTFQCGNRRAGKAITYSLVIAQLPAFYPDTSGYAGWTDVSGLDPFGTAVGQSYGYYNFGNTNQQGLGFSAAEWHNLGIKTPNAPTPAWGNTYATSINAVGDICGYYGSTPVVWPLGIVGSPSAFLSLPMPPGSGLTSALATRTTTTHIFGIDQRWIVGYGWNSTETDILEWSTPFNDGVNWGPFGFTSAGNAAYAYAFSDTLAVAGKAKFTFGAQFHALVTGPGAQGIQSSDDKGTFTGGTSSEAWDIRDESGAVGWSYNSAGYKRAFYLQTGSASLQDNRDMLPPLPGVTISSWNSAALGVNRLGQVVGWAQNNSGASRAFLCTGSTGAMIDLNTLLPGGSLWVLTSARSINDAGIIVGTGTYNGQSPRSWILYPTCQE